jgi:small subunit ribosomal protein S20
MAHSSSAKKRIRQNQKQRARNRWRKGQVREATKEFQEAAMHGSAEQAEQTYRDAAQTLDKVAAKGVIHKNTAARRKSRLAKRLNAAKARAAASA